MTTGLITHPACLRHEPPPGHPERPARLSSILTALEAEEFRPLVRREAPEANVDALARVHDRDYVEEVLAAIPSRGVVHFDADTSVSPGSRDAILRAAGAVVEAFTARALPWWGRTVEVRSGETAISGIARGIDSRGALLLELPDGRTAALVSGEARQVRLR